MFHVVKGWRRKLANRSRSEAETAEGKWSLIVADLSIFDKRISASMSGLILTLYRERKTSL